MIPNQGTYIGYGFIPGQGMCRRQPINTPLSHRFFCLPPSLPSSTSLSKSKEENVLWIEKMKKVLIGRENQNVLAIVFYLENIATSNSLLTKGQ